MNNFLVAIAVLMITALSALFAIPRAVDWNGYRGVIEEEASRIMGRDVRVSGDVKIRLLPSPTFSVSKIRIADTEANTGDPFFRAEVIRGRLSVAPLVRGVLEADKLVLTQPLLHLVLDDQGGGNWKTLGANARGRLPFMPSDVALQNVDIEGGTLVVAGQDQIEKMRLEQINGIFSADGLEGPFRFRGFFGSDQMRRDLRVSTTKQEADGSFRVKAALKQLDSGSAFALDARIIDLGSVPKIEGELTAQVPLPKLAEPMVAGKAQTAPNAASNEAPVEVKAALSATLRQVQLANLTIAFEQQGRPQILNGDADVDLSTGINLKATLAAKWLDLDQIIASPQTTSAAVAADTESPVIRLVQFAARLNGFNPDQGRASLNLTVEQANLGREPVSGLRLKLSGAGAETEIEELRLGLPGGARADIKGLMTGSGEETAFNGDMVLRGTSFGRFLSWASAGGVVLDAVRDGPFAMRGKVAASPGAAQAREFVGEFASTVIQGEVGYRAGTRREISLLVEGPQVDLRPLLPERVPGQTGTPVLSYLTAGSALAPYLKSLDAVLKIRAGQVLVPGAAFQDVIADIELSAEQVRVRQLRLLADHGVTVELDGTLKSATADQRATLRALVSADDAAGLAAVAELIDWPRALLPANKDRDLVTPLRLAGTMTFGAAEASPVDVVADGTLGRTTLSLRTRLGAGLSRWVDSPLDLSARLHGDGATTVAHVLTGGTRESAPGRTADGRGDITIDAVGRASAGLATRLRTSTADAVIDFKGRAVVQPGPAGASWRDGLSARGDVALKVADGADLGGWLGAGTLGLEGVGVEGTALVERRDGVWRVDRLAGLVGGTKVGGRLIIDGRSPQLKVTGELETGAISLAGLLRPVTAVAPKSRMATVPPWPSETLQFARIAALTGSIDFSADRLAVSDGVGLDRARFNMSMSDGRLEVRDLAGNAAGGQWTGGLKLDRTPQGVAATGVLQMAGVKADTMIGRAQPLGGGLSGMMTLTGRGSTLVDLIGSLSGKGTLTPDALQITALGPAGLAKAVDAGYAGPADATAASVRQSLTAAPSGTPVAVPSRPMVLEAANGVLTLAPQAFDTPDARLRARLSIDLKALTAAGDWRIEAMSAAIPAFNAWTATIATAGATDAPPPAPKPSVPLPPVTIAFTGGLGALSTATTTLTSDAFEREIAVRRVERDLAELERLRKLDEERARQEAERRQQAEDAKAAAAAANVPAQSPAPVPVPVPVPVPTAATPPVAPALAPATAPAISEPAPKSTDAPITLPVGGAAPPPPPAAPKAASPPPNVIKPPSYRPLSTDEQRRIFGGG